MTVLKTSYLGTYYLSSSNSPLDITANGAVHGQYEVHDGIGVVGFGEPVQLTNAGGITGASAKGLSSHYGSMAVDMGDGGSVTNTGSILGGNSGFDGGTGGIGILAAGPLSVVNDGTISGGAGYDTSSSSGGDGILSGFGPLSLTNESGGTIRGGYGGGVGVFAGSGGSIKDSGLIQGGFYSLTSGSPAGGIGVDLTHGGTLTVYHDGTVAGGGAHAGSSASGGAGVYLNGGTLITSGTISGGGNGSGGLADAVKFGSSPAKMLVSSGAVFNGAIGNFHYGDAIDLENVNPGFVSSQYNSTTHTLDAGRDGTLVFAGGSQLIFSSDGHGGTWVTCACFRRGTLIETEKGQRAVETLAIGDRVMTASGDLKALRWIGKRHYSAEALGTDPQMLPVLIRAGALGNFLPRRDLWVSPEHALYLDGALVPAALLTNGVSIVTDDSVVSVSYFHLEFDSQELVFAEGVAAESFVDDDSRQMFDNAPEFALLYPDMPRSSARFCAPRVEDGEPLQLIRQRIAEIAGIRTSASVQQPLAPVA